MTFGSRQGLLGGMGNSGSGRRPSVRVRSKRTLLGLWTLGAVVGLGDATGASGLV